MLSDHSRGVRLPKALIEQAGLSGEVEISVQAASIVIKSVARSRAGWAIASREMAKNGDDPMSIAWDEHEW